MEEDVWRKLKAREGKDEYKVEGQKYFKIRR